MAAVFVIYSEDEPESFLGKRVKIYWVKYQKYYSGERSKYKKYPLVVLVTAECRTIIIIIITF